MADALTKRMGPSKVILALADNYVDLPQPIDSLPKKRAKQAQRKKKVRKKRQMVKQTMKRSHEKAVCSSLGCKSQHGRRPPNRIQHLFIVAHRF